MQTPPDSAAHAFDRRGSSVDDAVAFYERVYDSRDITIGRVADGDFAWRYRSVGDDLVSAGTSAVGAHRWGVMQPVRQYVLAWATRPGIVLDSDTADPLVMMPGVPVMYPAHRSVTFDAQAGAQHLIRFDGAFLETLAAAHRHDVPGPLEFTRTPSGTDVEHLQAVIRSSASALLDSTTTRARRALLNVAIADAVVQAFDATPAGHPVATGGPRSLRRAQEWMIANAQRPIGIGDVAAAVGINARGLQAAFHRHTGQTPMQFLRDVRLHRTRTDLLAATPEESVADVARRWGFNHLGRFAGYYAETFGELPSASIHRGR